MGDFTYDYNCVGINKSTFHFVDASFFFQNIPKELDESAKVDGCSQYKAFGYVIVPVMWPGIITTGLFSFLLHTMTLR